MDRTAPFRPSRVMNDTPPVRVALLALPESTPAAIYGLLEVLSAVGTTWSSLTGENEVALRRFETHIVSAAGRPYPSPVGGLIAADRDLSQATATDVVIVTDVALRPDASLEELWSLEKAWARDRYEEGVTLCSVCTGSVFLASAGLLDGLEATTHWAAVPVFRSQFSAVQLRPERLLCPAGPEHRIVTAGGATAWTDLALWLIARYAGEIEARRIAKSFLIGERQNGQLPFAAMARPRQHKDGAISAAQAWIAEHYTSPAPVARMAGVSRLSERSFSRRFRAATGYSPIEYVQALRLEEAKQALETTDADLNEIASAVGYSDAVTFGRLFRKRVGVSPAQYRKRFDRAALRGRI